MPRRNCDFCGSRGKTYLHDSSYGFRSSRLWLCKKCFDKEETPQRKRIRKLQAKSHKKCSECEQANFPKGLNSTERRDFAEKYCKDCVEKQVFSDLCSAISTGILPKEKVKFD